MGAGAVMADIPPPPPGFKLDAPTAGAAIPPPPPGFTLDAAPDEQPSKTPGFLNRLGEQISGGMDLAGQGMKDVLSSPNKGALKAAAGGAQVLTSPLTAAMQAFVGDPIRNTGSSDPHTMGGFLRGAGANLAEDVAGMAMPTGLIGKGAGAVARGLVAKPALEAAVAAREAGYVLPPTMAAQGGKPSMVSRVLSGYGGKIKTAQDASVANQSTTNRLVNQEFNLPSGTTLNEKILGDIRKKAGNSYKAIKDSVSNIISDRPFQQAIGDLGSAASHAAAEFPDVMKNDEIKQLRDNLLKPNSFSTESGIELVKHLRAEAVEHLKALGQPKLHALGLAQRQAADAVDELIERNLAGIGKGDLVNKYREARQTIAKAHDVEGVMNPATGDISALGLRKLANKGRPLSGKLHAVAEAANAFPKAMQNVAQMGGAEALSPLDFFASGAGVTMGDPSLVAVAAGRPAARAGVLSEPYQNAMVGRKLPATPNPEADKAKRMAVLLSLINGQQSQ